MEVSKEAFNTKLTTIDSLPEIDGNIENLQWLFNSNSESLFTFCLCSWLVEEETDQLVLLDLSLI